MRKILSTSFLLIFSGIVFYSFLSPLPFSSLKNPKPIRTLVIDAGHGGKDPGALGHGFKEKDLTLKMALELKRLVNENMPDVKVVMTRSTDVFIELHKRGEVALNNKADFFVSIHCNSVPKNVSSPIGPAVYILGVNHGQERYESHIRENEAVTFEENYKDLYGGFDPKSPEGDIFYNVMKNVYRSESMKLAAKVESNLKTAGRKSYGVKQAPFIVLWGSGVPSLLIETGYISHTNESAYLASKEGQNEIANSIYKAILSYNEEVAGNSKKVSAK